MSGESKIFSKNFLSTDNDWSVSSNTAEGSRLFDRDKASVWTSDGEDSDADAISTYAGLKENGQDIERAWDTIMVLNHNLADFTVYYWDGSAYQTAYTVSSLAADYKIASFTERTSQRFLMYASGTQTPDQEKSIGEIILCKSVLTFDKDMVSYDASFVPRKSNDLVLADGRLHRSFVAHSLNRTTKYEAKIQFDFLTLAEIEVLQALKEAGNPFLWQPESVTRPDEIYEVYWVGNFTTKYISSYKGAGYRLAMELREV